MSTRLEIASEKASNLRDKLLQIVNDKKYQTKDGKEYKFEEKELVSICSAIEGINYVINSNMLGEYTICYLMPYYNQKSGVFDNKSFLAEKEEKLKQTLQKAIKKQQGLSEEDLKKLIEQSVLPPIIDELMAKYYQCFCELCII